MKDYYPLSKTEEGIFVSCLEETDAYNLAHLVNFGKNLNEGKFIDAIKKVFDMHPYLFTVLFQGEDGKIYKKIRTKLLDIQVKEVESLDIESKPFKMLDNHLFRLGLYKYDGDYYFYFDFHHIIFDGFSIHLFFKEVMDTYHGIKPKKELYDANKYALDEEKQLQSSDYQKAKDYFEMMIKDPEVDSTLVYDKNDGTKAYKSYNAKIAIKDEDVKKLTKAYNLKTSTFFLAAFSYLLATINMDDKALFLTVNNGRNELLKNSLGMFVKTYPIYAELKDNIKEFLEDINEENINNVNHLLYPFSDLMKDMNLNANILFAYQGDYFYQYKGMYINQLKRKDGKENIAIELHRDNGEFFVWVEYRSDLYEDSTIQHLIELYNQTLKEFLTKKTLSEVNLISVEEENLLDSLNETNLSSIDPNNTIVDDFKKAVKDYPEHLAVVFKDNKYTYQETDKITNKIANKLLELGATKEKVVSILIKKSEFVVLASLGVLKTGAAYQPLDPTYPVDRLNFMVKDADACALILDRELDGILTDFKGPKLYTDELLSLDNDKDPGIKNNPEDLFIMLYTSGSTGVPKGVMLEHRNLNAFITFYKQKYEVDANCRMSAYASYGFDANMQDLYTAITSGSTVYIIPDEMRLDLVKLGEYFNENKITHSIITTQVGRQFVEEIEAKYLKHFFVGGEKLVPVEPPKNYILHNAYGPTEGTVFCTDHTVDKLYYRVPIGKNNFDYKFYILDKNKKRLPTMVSGELYISGPQVARGYLNRDKENKEAFLTNPFETDPNFQKLYKTGDIVRLLPDGVVDFIGRKDGQVKIRGFRVELTEVEKVIREYPGIKDATVKDFTDPAGVKFICAYIVSDNEIDVEDLNKFIGSKKPPYMIPAFTMQIDKIPLNQNQKVNKKALPIPQLKTTEIIKPENQVEEDIYQILKDVLGHESFGVTTNLYEAGLTSVSSIRLTILLSKKFNRDVDFADLKNNPTIRELADLFAGNKQEDKFEILDEYPITKTQEGIFVESVSKPGSTNYNIPFLLKLPADFDLDKLEKALIKVIDNHPYLKTTLYMNDNGDIRARRNNLEAVVERRTINNLEPNLLVRPFEILNGRLYRVEIIETKEDKYLYLDFHHIICDGTSEAIILNDLSKAFLDQDLDEEEYTGFEVALKEQENLKTDKLDKAKQFYQNVLKDIDGEYLFKKDLKTEEIGRLKSVDYIIELDNKKLKSFIDKNKLTNNAYFNFAFAFTLSKYLYKDDSLYTTIYNGRNSSKVANTVSMLVKTLPVYVKYQEDDLILNILNETKTLLSDLQTNDLYSFADIAKDYDISSDIIFAYQGDDFRFDNIGGKKVETILLESDTPKSPFGLDIFLEDNKFRCHYEWDSSLYNDNTIASFNRLYELVLNELMQKRFIKDINTLPEYDLNLYHQFNETKEEIPNVSFNKLVEKQAELHPDHLAVIGKGGKFTYKEFNERCNKVAHALIDSDVKQEDKIVMLMPRIALAYVVRQGIIKSGGAFVPIDPKYPDDRIEYIITNSGSKKLISTKDIIKDKADLIKKTNIQALAIEDIMESKKISNPNLEINPNNLCYIIYTSGSTGKPKGVMISHHNLVNYVSDGRSLATKMYRDIEEGAVGCSFSSFSFDASLQEECIPLSHGYTAVIASEEEIENPLLLAKTLKENGVNIMFMTPSFVSNLIDVKEFVDVLKNFKALDMGAEAVPAELCQKLRDLGINANLYNGYGPTETTITCTYHKVVDKYVTIGRPFANTAIYMLDKHGHILPTNAIGDLTIAGDCVGIGYLGLEQMTKEKFINVDGMRAYRSGDLARYNGEGNIEFFGRLDNQVKLRGLRVELDEIEKVLNSYPNISRSIIVVKTNQTDGDYLAAYFTSPYEIDKADLTNHMAKSLTPYMIPKVMMQLEKLPLTPNGKIDKKALPDVEIEKKNKEIRKPKNDLQKTLCNIFAKALGQKEIGVDEDFFDLGGTSLSASKIAMLALQANLPIAYKDVFEYSTVLEMEKYINQASGNQQEEKEEEFNSDLQALKYNNVKYIDEVKNDRPIGKVLLTGATGFLGIHVLKELLDNKNQVIALVRGGKLDSKKRLSGLLAYYFDSPLDEEIEKYVQIIDDDITDDNLGDLLKDYQFDTIINCAAIVKHFAQSDIIERINVGGVLNLIKIAKERKARLIQISTLSVAGENIDNKFDAGFRMKENMLWFDQDISNKYVHSKFNAEKAILEEIENGLDAKIIRVGNLMGRNSDGEFQANSITNGFMRDLKGYATLKKFPVNSMDIEVDFSPIDEVAKTILALATTPAKFTVFHSANNHMIQFGDIIYEMNKLGYDIEVVSDQEFVEAMKEMMADEEKNMLVSSLISYSSSDAHTHSFILSDNEFTNKALYHLNYKWPITDNEYLEQAIMSLATLGFFERTDI